MDHDLSRRHALATVAAGSTALAGCLDFLSGDGTDDSSEEDDGNGTNGAGSTWPAIESGEVIDDFEDLDRWGVQSGRLEAVPDEARTGSQAAAIESDERTAEITIGLSDELDLEGWDTSLAVKPESATQIIVEFLAPNRNERLNTVRAIPNGYDGWFRLDCGYEHKPEGEPDLSTVTRLNVIAVGPDDGPTRMLVDDLRRTEAVDNGKAILACYGGHDSHFEHAAPRLEERGWAAAVPVDPGRIGEQSRMGIDELHELRDRGWDVCSYPRGESDLTEQPAERQRAVVESTRDSLADRGFEDGSRHFFAPDWRRMTPETNEIVRQYHESGFLFGSCPTGAPPTGIHMTPVIWGPALHNGVRRHINLCDQYRQLTVIRIPRIVEGDGGSNSMSLEEFEHLLDHLENRGLDVITPSDIVDGMDDIDRGTGDETGGKPDGTILEAGQSHSFGGDGTDESDTFDLDEGIVTARFTHDGDGTFAAELTPVDGDLSNERLSTTAGVTDGESMTTVGGGTYRLVVDADGPWSIEVDQPAVHGDDLAEPPIEASGSGSGIVGPLWADDGLALSVSHDGDGAFVVDDYGADGSWEQLVNQRGEFDASRSSGASGVSWIDIEADGNWTLDIGNP